ncbi:MAG: nitroreductase family protein [Bacilli bacterium]|jgi:nitroreductase|nr:nitroreductase family protein [Bacilli bacterium]MDY0064262.1 nitroreductase family protein [Bacilli bacterium]
MDVFEAMQKRRSVRKFTDQKVEDEKVQTILHSAMSGPSACNRRPWEFYVVTNEVLLEQIKKASRFSNFNSPMVIIVAGNLHHALPLQLSEYWVQDCSAAVENILLSATALGLGSVWCGLKPQKRPMDRVRAILGIPDYIEPLALIHVGYPAQESIPRDQYEESKLHYFK